MVFKEFGIEVLSCVTAGLSSGNDNLVLQVFYIFLIRFFFTEALIGTGFRKRCQWSHYQWQGLTQVFNIQICSI